MDLYFSQDEIAHGDDLTKVTQSSKTLLTIQVVGVVQYSARIQIEAKDKLAFERMTRLLNAYLMREKISGYMLQAVDERTVIICHAHVSTAKVYMAMTGDKLTGH